MPKKNAPETIVYPVRFSKTDYAWLQTTAAANGVEVPQLLRWAIEALRQYVIAHGGNIHLPINIREFWEQIQATRPAAQLRAAEDPPVHEPPGDNQPRRSVQFEPAPPSKRRRQQ